MFRYWITRLRLWDLDRRYTSKENKISLRKYVEELGQLLDPPKLMKSRSTQFLGIYFELDLETLDDLVATYEQINLRLIAKGLIKAELPEPRNVPVSLDRFLTVTRNGYYADVVGTVSRLKSSVLQFCKLMEKTEEAEYGEDEYNRRVTQRLLSQTAKLLRLLVITR